MSNTAITGVNASLAATAAIQADRAHKERCKAELLSYRPQSASVAEMQSYAQCVQKLHPSEESTGMYKFCIATLLVCTIIGAIVGGVRSYGDFVMDAIGGALVGVTVGGAGLILIAAVGYLIYA